MARYLNPKVDLTFKRIFGEHPDLLIDFLNAVMPFEKGRKIETIEYLPAEQTPERPDRKNSIVDVKCKDNTERHFIVEMQMHWTESFRNRMVFNAGKAYVKQLGRSEDYHLLKPVYSLVILNENFDRKTEQFYHHFQIVNRDNIDEIIPGFEFILVELTDKFKPGPNADRKLMVLWLRFLKEVGENMTMLPKEMKENEYINYAAQLCEEGAYTPEELAFYDGYWDAIRTEKGLKSEGRAEGLVEGEAIGLEKGEAIGLEKVVINSNKAG
jgi:predicted transposase/invertase (TIGR01784 family)